MSACDAILDPSTRLFPFSFRATLLIPARALHRFPLNVGNVCAGGEVAAELCGCVTQAGGVYGCLPSPSPLSGQKCTAAISAWPACCVLALELYCFQKKTTAVLMSELRKHLDSMLETTGLFVEEPTGKRSQFRLICFSIVYWLVQRFTLRSRKKAKNILLNLLLF